MTMTLTTEPLVKAKVGGKAYSCLVDSGATFSAIPNAPISIASSPQTIPVVGIDGHPQVEWLLQECDVEVGGQIVKHAFLQNPGVDLCVWAAEGNPGKAATVAPVHVHIKPG